MGAQEALDRVYASTSDPDEQKALYDDWAASYDHDLEVSGYATPGRLAALVDQYLDDRDAPIFDFGCGSGMSGRALAAVGFTTIDGADLSSGMLEQAGRSSAYRRTWQLTAGELAVEPGEYRAVVACGVVSVGAAPPGALTLIAAAVAPGDLLVVSYNDHTLDDADYMAALTGVLDDGFEEVDAEHGVHIAARESTSTIFVLRRTR